MCDALKKQIIDARRITSTLITSGMYRGWTKHQKNLFNKIKQRKNREYKRIVMEQVNEETGEVIETDENDDDWCSIVDDNNCGY